MDFNPGQGTSTLPAGGGGFIVKLNSTGALNWARSIAKDETSTYSPTVWDLAVDAAGAVYATGNYAGTVDFDPGAGTDIRTSAGGLDGFVLKLSSAGSFAWAETYGNSLPALSRGIAVDSAGIVHLTGGYQGTVDFDPDPVDVYERTTPGTDNTGFLLKLRQS